MAENEGESGSLDEFFRQLGSTLERIESKLDLVLGGLSGAKDKLSEHEVAIETGEQDRAKIRSGLNAANALLFALAGIVVASVAFVSFGDFATRADVSNEIREVRDLILLLDSRRASAFEFEDGELLELRWPLDVAPSEVFVQPAKAQNGDVALTLPDSADYRAARILTAARDGEAFAELDDPQNPGYKLKIFRHPNGVFTRFGHVNPDHDQPQVTAGVLDAGFHFATGIPASDICVTFGVFRAETLDAESLRDEPSDPNLIPHFKRWTNQEASEQSSARP